MPSRVRPLGQRASLRYTPRKGGVMMTRIVLVTLFLSLFCVVHQPNAQNRLPLEKVADVPLAGSATRFDYQTVDENLGRLYIAHLGANRLTVFDTKNRQIIFEVADLKSVHGVVAAPELHRVYATATGTNELAVIEVFRCWLACLRVIPRTAWRTIPRRKIYVSNNRSSSEAV